MGFLNQEHKLAKKFSKASNASAAAQVETMEAEKARVLAAEQSKQRVFGLLGAPGTYDLPGTGSSSGQYAAGDIYSDQTTFAQAGSPLAREQFKGGGGYSDEFGQWKSREGILDPEKYAEDVSESAAFRIQSRRTAEAEQLLAREGPMWDQLSNSVYGVINEGAATQLREDVRALKTQAAKGGTARRTALAEAQQMQAQEQANQMRVQQTWKANLALFDVVRQNADNVLQQNYSFIDNLPHMQAAYSSAMSNLSNMLANNTLPGALNAKREGIEMKLAHPKVSLAQRLIGAVVGAASGYVAGGGGLASVIGAGAGGMAGAFPEAGASIEQGMAGGALGGIIGQASAGKEEKEQDPYNQALTNYRNARLGTNGGSGAGEMLLPGESWTKEKEPNWFETAYRGVSGIFSSANRKMGLTK